MAFKTAVFFDIENLLKGYSFSQQLITNLSLTTILNTIKKENNLEGVAVQKAYANWSDPRLAVMRSEINELGIDPIQVFGFSREQKKNAADIQLAIDAIDLAYTRPAIDTFVIVSGDGGFAALAKKLHEYGKTVIGCAYRSSTNNVFRAVSDSFVWINDPEQDADVEQQYSKNNSVRQVTDPRNVRLVNQVKSLLAKSENHEIIKKTQEIIYWYATDNTAKNDMVNKGIVLSAVQEAIRAVIIGFQQTNFGFPKFVEYLQHVCSGTDLCIAKSTATGVVLTFRKSHPTNWEVLPDITHIREVHSTENYRSILETGVPILRLPDSSTLITIANWLANNARIKDSFGELLEKIALAEPDISSEEIKQTLLCFASADVFIREPSLVPISEQTLRLRQELQHPQILLEQIYHCARKKIKQYLGDINENTLKNIISLSN
ncbi:MAG: NYN domain-containing protein [Pseudomonadales bacterium]|nr:NYN domain-containing protein [Pseudomonadales bacterium]